MDFRFLKALHFCDYDGLKAKELLEIIDMSLNTKTKAAESVVLVDCMWNYDGECWVDMPDSKHKCNGKCDRYEVKK